MRRIHAVIGCTAIAVVLSACGGAKDPAGPAQSGGAKPAAPAKGKAYGTIDELAAAAKKSTDANSTVRLAIQVDAAGAANVTTTCAMNTSKNNPAFDCTTETTAAGTTSKIQMRAVGKAFYLSLPTEQREGKPWLKIDPAAAGPQSEQFAKMLRELHNSSDLDRVAPKGAKLTGSAAEQLDGKSATRYDLDIDVKSVADKADDPETKQAMAAMQASGLSTIKTQLWLDELDLPAKVALKFTVPGAGQVTTTSRFSDWGKPLQLAAPPAAEVDEL